jgi:hypothetical protein
MESGPEKKRDNLSHFLRKRDVRIITLIFHSELQLYLVTIVNTSVHCEEKRKAIDNLWAQPMCIIVSSNVHSFLLCTSPDWR